MIKAGKKFVFELEGSKTGVRDFTISLCNELIESFIQLVYFRSGIWFLLIFVVLVESFIR